MFSNWNIFALGLQSEKARLQIYQKFIVDCENCHLERHIILEKPKKTTDVGSSIHLRRILRHFPRVHATSSSLPYDLIFGLLESHRLQSRGCRISRGLGTKWVRNRWFSIRATSYLGHGIFPALVNMKSGRPCGEISGNKSGRIFSHGDKIKNLAWIHNPKSDVWYSIFRKHDIGLIWIRRLLLVKMVFAHF